MPAEARMRRQGRSCPRPPPAFSLTAMALCNPVGSPPVPLVTLNWSAAATATSYLIIRDGAQVRSVDGSTTTFNDTNVLRGQTYVYIVRAVGPGGSSDSNAVTLSIDPSICEGCVVTCTTQVPQNASVLVPVRFALQQSPCSAAGVVWTFGDGTTSADFSPSHTYTSAGAFHWTVTVAGDGNDSCQNSGTITVTAPAPPTKRRAV